MNEIRTPQLTLESYIEAMLFVAGEPVAIGQLAEWLDVSSPVIEDALLRLRQQLEG
ncbi:MAG: Segregation and condensation complex subunit ScpB, partial [Chloroflexota bacterium]